MATINCATTMNPNDGSNGPSVGEAGNEDLNKPPGPADPLLVGSIAQQGVIGQCLRDALESLVDQPSGNREADGSVSDDANSRGEGQRGHDDDVSVLSGSIAAGRSQPRASGESTMKLRQHMVDNIMERFGQAVAEAKWTSPLILKSSSSSSLQEENGKVAPPAALIKGRVDHYNRFNGKWRIIVKDTQLKRKVPLSRDRPKKIRPPLWETVGEQEAVKLPFSTVQILAYDDLL